MFGNVQIFFMGYYHFFLGAIWVINHKTNFAKLEALLFIWTVPIIMNVIGLGVFKWNY